MLNQTRSQRLRAWQQKERDDVFVGLRIMGCVELNSESSGKKKIYINDIEVNMELSAVGERVFAAESIIKRRIRRVCSSFFYTHPCFFV